MSDRTRIEFKAEIVLEDQEIDRAGGLEQAVQNEIGPAGAMLVRVTGIGDADSPSRGQNVNSQLTKETDDR